MSSLGSIGEQLRAAREQLGISCDDIAAATRINKKFLMEIEEGITPDVPPTYVRAFIKAFAECVNLDARNLLQQLAGEGKEHHVPLPDQAPPFVVSTAEQSISSAAVSPTAENRPPHQRQLRTLLIVIVLIIASLIVLVVWLRRDHNDHPVQEISFSDIVKEHEPEGSSVNKSKDSSIAPISIVKPLIKLDSLNLEAAAIESVWVHLVIDGGQPREYILTRQSHLRWKAKSSFLVSVGNAASISFTLNGRKLETLGKNNKPVKNITLSRETLEKLQSESSIKGNG